MENKETVFRVGDRVFNHQLGWGKVYKINNDSTCPILVSFENGNQLSFTLCGRAQKIARFPSLSFTEYDFVNGGFSQERPIELPKRGDIVWVRDSNEQRWLISHFVKKKDGLYFVSDDNVANNTFEWKYLTTKNPYENEQ